MKKNEVKVGQTYRCKVSGSVADVRITAENSHGGWDATNVLTGRKVHIKSAQRLRGKTPQRPAKRSKIVSLAEYEADAEQASAERAAGQVRKDIAKAVSAVVNGDLAKGVTVPTGAKRAKKDGKATAKARTPKQRHTGKHAATSGDTGGKKPMSCLAAAAQILQECGGKEGPLSCAEMIERMGAMGYWKPRKGGKTPANTLYSAILREINNKGEASRFEKAERGKFALSAKR